jgi:hypothetical protein
MVRTLPNRNSRDDDVEAHMPRLPGRVNAIGREVETSTPLFRPSSHTSERDTTGHMPRLGSRVVPGDEDVEAHMPRLKIGFRPAEHEADEAVRPAAAGDTRGHMPRLGTRVQPTEDDTEGHMPLIRRSAPLLARQRARRSLVLAVAAVALVAVVMMPSSSAGAVTRATTGAWTHTSGYCGGRTATVFSSNGHPAFEWRQVSVYVNGRRWYTTNWEKMDYFNPTKGVYLADGWTEIWVLYADDLGGGRFAYASEWTNFNNGSTRCLAW